MHDIYRNGDKGDPAKRGDIESGKLLQAELIRQGVPYRLAKRQGELNASKSKRETLGQHIVDGADCTEILRFRRFAKGFNTYNRFADNYFNLAEWPLYAELTRHGWQEFADGLLHEFHLFSRLTEHPSIKLPLESESKNILIDHLVYLKRLNDKFSLFPLLTALLESKLKECPSSTDLSDKLLALGSPLAEQVGKPDFHFEW